METMKEEWPEHKVVYFIRAVKGGPVKIGRAANLRQRFVDLQRMNPFPLRVIGHLHGYSELENKIHERYKHLRLHGEWFSWKRPLSKEAPTNGIQPQYLQRLHLVQPLQRLEPLPPSLVPSFRYNEIAWSDTKLLAVLMKWSKTDWFSPHPRTLDSLHADGILERDGTLSRLGASVLGFHARVTTMFLTGVDLEHKNRFLHVLKDFYEVVRIPNGVRICERQLEIQDAREAEMMDRLGSG